MTTTAHTAPDRTGHEKWLIHCPDIASHTLLHLNIQGTSYALRDFTGALTGPHYNSGDGQPFRAVDEHGLTIASTTEFQRAISFEWRIDVFDLGVPLTNTRRWRDIITRQNDRLGIDQPIAKAGPVR